VNYNASTEPLFKELKLLNLEDIINLELGKLMFQHSIRKLPSPLMDLFKKGSDIHVYETRFKENIHPRKRKYAQLDKSFLCKAPTLWSNLKTEIKECLNTGLFVKNYKRFCLHG